MNVQILAFTDRGFALAQRLAELLGGEAQRCQRPLSLAEWTAANFPAADALVFVGAAGIAVRAIAPYVKSKASDPAVVVVDEGANFAISLLSGHLGGANELTRRIATLLGAAPVITTATDVRGVFAVDEWAKSQNCAVVEPERIKRVSAALLSGRNARFYSPWPVAGALPAGLLPAEPGTEDFSLGVYDDGRDILHLVPRIAVLGVGCRRGAAAESIETAYRLFLEENRLFSQAICRVCSIDLKAAEPGLLDFCRVHSLPFATYSAVELLAAPGEFSSSEFVKSVTGVDNVCERAAVVGGGGALSVKKTVYGGVTMALALAPFTPVFEGGET